MRCGTKPLLAILAVLYCAGPELTWTTASLTFAQAAASTTLDNGVITAHFDRGNLVRLADARAERTIAFSGDSGSVTIDGEKLSTAGLTPLEVRAEKEVLVATYGAGKRKLQVVYELRPGWRFVAKQLVAVLPEGSRSRIDAVEVFRAELQEPVAGEHRMGGGSRGVLLRFGEAGKPSTAGLFQTLQNPFMEWRREGKTVSMAYKPEMEWQATYGPFASDRACFGLYRSSGVLLPAHALPEWKYVREPEKAFDRSPQIDTAEIEALANCVRSFLLAPPKKSLRVHVGWCENDYQIDVATPGGRAEYKRIIDQAAAVGCGHVLFAPTNSDVSRLPDNVDAWGWENLLWLGLGQKIRRGEWNIEKDPIPPSIQEMLDHAKEKNVRLLAYVYPTLGWKQNPEWTQWCEGKTGGYVGADTGVRSFQDWFVDRLVAFQKRTGISGYSFDHWWIAYDKASSKYAQWYGCRRIMEELRRRVPEIVIDGRQQYQWFGPWTWLGGSYPHPTSNDEQPGSYPNFPDLHFDRVSGDRQRFATWYYRVDQYTPVELLPGYLTHQTGRIDDKGQCPRTPFRTRDWDLLGWKYSVISSIGTAPLMHTVSMLPARDEAEFRAFSAADQAWFRGWMDWTDQNASILRYLRPILGPPTLGRIDGTAAIRENRGFVFLFNPNYRALEAQIKLDGSIGLTKGKVFALREIYPQEGRLIGKPHAGLWNHGDTVAVRIKGPQAMVLEILPGEDLPRPAIFNVAGKSELRDGTLTVTDLRGETGTQAEIVVLPPPGQEVKRLRVNGHEFPKFNQADGVISFPVAFRGGRFEHCQQIGDYKPEFSGPLYRATIKIPSQVFDQMKARRRVWPVTYSEEELRAAYLGSDRLLLFAQIAEPKPKMTLEMKIDGKPIEVKKAFSGIVPNDSPDRTFVGFYADISRLSGDVEHSVELTLPELQPGQFQGLFVENVETEYTREIVTD